ncbi:hypothetical protein WN51_08480 [Melipona quadrifasciata]|uniref:Spondin domain-containing protein n=1 Tax=Melipona quadrifasciata TaxID=166423 RepID=A0A0M9AC79_9HYME|nr:hypothetical protein WN51_08480 [Melipona quadrifasciata]
MTIKKRKYDNNNFITIQFNFLPLVKIMLRGTWLQCSTLLLLLLGTRLLFVVAQCGSFAQDRQEKEDKQDKLALYKVTLRTYWSRARFPRHYPEWKPPAQFGKLIDGIELVKNVKICVFLSEEQIIRQDKDNNYYILILD